MNPKNKKNELRFYMLSWVILPIIIVWILTNYLINTLRQVGNQGKQVILSCQITPGAVLTDNKSVFKWDGSGLITFWFDDAWDSQYLVALPVLRDNGLVGALSVSTNLVNKPYMDWEQIGNISKSGWEIVSHSETHICDLSQINSDKVLGEIGESQKILLQRSFVVKNFVPPCGNNSEAFKKVVKDYYLSLRSSIEGLNDLPVADPYGLKIHTIMNSTTLKEVNNWLTEAKMNRKWLILVFHQIGEGQNKYEVSTRDFIKFVGEAKNTGLPFVLPRQALEISQ